MKKQTVGESAILSACLFFYPCANVLVKVVGTHCSGLVVSFWRFFIGAVLSVGVMAFWEKERKIREWRTWILRGVYGAAAMVAGYMAIQMTGSGRAVLLANTYPVFVAVFGVTIFKERTSWNQWAALVLCLGGILLVFQDKSQYSFLGNCLGLLAGILGGLAVHYMKKTRERNSPSSVYLSACLFGVLPGFTAGPHLYQGFHPHVWILLMFIGILAFSGQWFASYGFKYVSATAGSIIGFAETLVTIGMSWFFLGEEMRPRFFAGALLILLGLLFNQRILLGRGKISDSPES